MNKKRLGWGITIISTVFAVLVNLIPIENTSSMLLLPLLLLILLLLLGGLFTGQILLIWHYLDFFKRWYGFAIALASYCLLFGTWSYFNNTLHETSRWLSYINAAVSVWLMVSVFTIGIVIFIFLIANDYGLRIMALAALGSMCRDARARRGAPAGGNLRD